MLFVFAEEINFEIPCVHQATRRYERTKSMRKEMTDRRRGVHVFVCVSVQVCVHGKAAVAFLDVFSLLTSLCRIAS